MPLTFDAVFMGGAPTYRYGPHSLYAYSDNGEWFERRSVLPFDHDYYYVTDGLLDSGGKHYDDGMKGLIKVFPKDLPPKGWAGDWRQTPDKCPS